MLAFFLLAYKMTRTAQHNSGNENNCQTIFLDFYILWLTCVVSVAETGASARFLKNSLRVLEWIFVNSVKIDGDASDFEKDEVENDFYLSISKNTIQSFRHLAFSESGACLKQFTGFNLTSKLQEVQV